MPRFDDARRIGDVEYVVLLREHKRVVEVRRTEPREAEDLKDRGPDWVLNPADRVESVEEEIDVLRADERAVDEHAAHDLVARFGLPGRPEGVVLVRSEVVVEHYNFDAEGVHD